MLPLRCHCNYPTANASYALIPVTGVTPAPSGGRVHTKFVYVSALRACVLVVPSQDVYFLKTS